MCYLAMIALQQVLRAHVGDARRMILVVTVTVILFPALASITSRGSAATRS